MQQMFFRGLVVAGLTLMLGVLGACGTGGGHQSKMPQTQAAQTPMAPEGAVPALPQEAQAVKVGILLPLSGPNKSLGHAMLEAAQMALFDMGYAQFELIPRDTGSSPAQAEEAARSALASGAQLLLGPVFAPDVRAVKPVAERAGVNVLSFSTDWTLAGGNVYVMGFMPFDQVARVTRYAAAQKITQIGVLAPDHVYGRAVSTTFATQARQNGISVPSMINFPAQGDGAAPFVSRFAAEGKGAQAVLLPAGGAQAAQVAAQLRLNGFPSGTLKLLGTGLFDETGADHILRGNPDFEGAWFAAPSPALRQKFEERFAAAYGAPPPRIATLPYDATALAVVLARQGFAKGNTPAYDRAALMNPNGFAGIDGIFRFKAGGVVERGLAVLGFQQGQIVVLEEAPKTFQSVSK